MTLDEAIEHAKEVARTCDDSQRAFDHIQLAEWLRRARGADKAAKWYTAKIYELENRSKALETLIDEKEAENTKLKRAAERDADVLESLNLSLEESQDENARLREQVVQLKDDWESERDYADQMEANAKRAVSENAKLRELVSLYHYGATHDASPSDALAWSCKVDSLRRELRIEVDDD